MAELQPTSQHRRTVIFLHGRDSNALEFSEDFLESQTSNDLTLPEIFTDTKWLFPTALMITSSRFGCEMSQWFDMHSTEDPHDREYEQDLVPAREQIQEIIALEAEIVGAGNVVLGGISQGCAVAIHALLRGHPRLGGFIGLCGWMPRRDEITTMSTGEAKKTPVLLCHAQGDDVVNVRFGGELRDSLIAIGMKVRWQEYPDGGHWVNEPRGVDDMVSFLKSVSG
jgi:predicted esterase